MNHEKPYEEALSAVVPFDAGNEALKERNSLSRERIAQFGENMPMPYAAYFIRAAESAAAVYSAKKTSAKKPAADRKEQQKQQKQQKPKRLEKAEKSEAPEADLWPYLQLWQQEMQSLGCFHAMGRLEDETILLETLIQLENVFEDAWLEHKTFPEERAVRSVLYSYFYDYLSVFAEEAVQDVLMPQAEKQRLFGAAERKPLRLLDYFLLPEDLLSQGAGTQNPFSLSLLSLIQGDRLKAKIIEELENALFNTSRAKRNQSCKQSGKREPYEKAHAHTLAAKKEAIFAEPLRALFAPPFSMHQQTVNRILLAENKRLWKTARMADGNVQNSCGVHKQSETKSQTKMIWDGSNDK